MSKKAKILIVEDNRELLKTLRMRLRDEGYRVVGAEDGVQAITLARQERPDVILLDLGLPAGDGFTVIKRLAKFHHANEIPIIVITGQPKEEYEQQALEAGAVAYLTKPFETKQLLAAIRETLGESNSLVETVTNKDGTIS
jgi:two-component system response regulator VicR